MAIARGRIEMDHRLTPTVTFVSIAEKYCENLRHLEECPDFEWTVMLKKCELSMQDRYKKIKSHTYIFCTPFLPRAISCNE